MKLILANFESSLLIMFHIIVATNCDVSSVIETNKQFFHLINGLVYALILRFLKLITQKTPKSFIY